jgi:hypothetical protein
MLGTVKMARSWHFVVAGAFSIVLGGLILYSAI